MACSKHPLAAHVAAAIARGQGGAAQAKPAGAVQAKPAMAPHVAAGIAAGRGGGAPVQAKPAHPPAPRAPVVQRMEEENPYAKKFGLYDFKKTAKSPRLRQLQEERSQRNRQRGPYQNFNEQPKKKTRMWNGSTRPSFEESTWTTMLGGCTSKVDASGITVYRCTANLKHVNAIYVPRYSDLASLTATDLETHFGKQTTESKKDFLASANVITLDHKTAWKRYIWDNAAPDEDGEITSRAARDAYNDTNNLEAMCQSCNSSKNGERGVFD